MILAILFAARAATGFQFQSVGSTADALMNALAANHTHIGLLLGAYLLPGVFVVLPAGLLGRHVPEKTLGLAGLSMMAASGLVLAQADNFALALAARLAGGVGATVVVLVATKMTSDHFVGRELVPAMALLQMSWPFGAMIALPVQAMIREWWGWPAAMLSGGLCAAAVLFAFAVVPAVRRSSVVVTGSPKTLPRLLWWPVVTAGFIWGMMNLACVLFFSYAPQLMASRGYAPASAASLTSLSIWLTIVAIPVGGYLVQRFGSPLGAIRICGMASAVVLMLFMLDQYAITACLLFGVAVAPLSGAILSLPAAMLPEEHRSFGLGVFFTCFYVLMAIGPPLVGRLQDLFASPSAAFVAASVLLVGMLPVSTLFSALVRRAEQPGDRGAITGSSAHAPSGATS